MKSVLWIYLRQCDWLSTTYHPSMWIIENRINITSLISLFLEKMGEDNQENGKYMSEICWEYLWPGTETCWWISKSEYNQKFSVLLSWMDLQSCLSIPLLLLVFTIFLLKFCSVFRQWQTGSLLSPTTFQRFLFVFYFMIYVEWILYDVICNINFPQQVIERFGYEDILFKLSHFDIPQRFHCDTRCLRTPVHNSAGVRWTLKQMYYFIQTSQKNHPNLGNIPRFADIIHQPTT